MGLNNIRSPFCSNLACSNAPWHFEPPYTNRLAKENLSLPPRPVHDKCQFVGFDYLSRGKMDLP
jgi:hypothetical protein